MRECQLNRAENIPQCRMKLVKYFGIDYYQTMDLNEWETKKQYIFVRKDGVNTIEDLCNFMVREQVIREPYGYP